LTTTKNKTDLELKTDVLAELTYEPTVKVTDVGVQVKEGVVTLTGHVSSYSEKWHAIESAKRVAGVRAIADEIRIHLPDSMRHTDGDIAGEAATHIAWSTSLPKGAVKVSVREGCITLTGELEWWYQKRAAEHAVQHLHGVKEVTNLITIKPTHPHGNIEAAITSAFERNAVLEARKIQVQSEESRVTLRGTVKSYAERDEAERTAWAAPGVYSVDNQIQVEWFWGLTD